MRVMRDQAGGERVCGEEGGGAGPEDPRTPIVKAVWVPRPASSSERPVFFAGCILGLNRDL